MFIKDPMNNNNVPFEPATKLSAPQSERDSEYAVVERGSYAGATFYLRHGQGVVRLEAWTGNKRLAVAMAARAELLSLDVWTSAGYVEAVCHDVLKIHKL